MRSSRWLATGLAMLCTATLTAVDPPELIWAGDSEGGAPYVEADPSHPDRVIGFEVEIADLLARGLGRTARFVNITFANLPQSIARGDANLGLNGVEDTPANRATLATTIPYYRFREVLSVRPADASRYRTLADLRGRRVATLAGTIAYEILLGAEREHALVPVSYEDDTHPYTDLVVGRVDAVLLDNVVAERLQKKVAGFMIQPDTVATGHYVGLVAPANTALRGFNVTSRHAAAASDDSPSLIRITDSLPSAIRKGNSLSSS